MEPPATDPAAELAELEQELDDVYASLSTADCAVACRALESMIRAADRICSLEPGPRCTRARKKVADAKRRVREACPDCAAATAALPHPPVEPAQEPDDVEEHADMAEPADAPPSEESRGGCAACCVGQRGNNGIGAVAALMIALGLAGARRRRRRQ